MRLVCVTDVQRNQVKQICSDPMIQAKRLRRDVYSSAASVASAKEIAIKPTRTLAEYSASNNYTHVVTPVSSLSPPDIGEAESNTQ